MAELFAGFLSEPIKIVQAPRMTIVPITIKVAHTLLADADIFESFCDNERDRVHLENAKPKP